jgi:hypothetical protein
MTAPTWREQYAMLAAEVAHFFHAQRWTPQGLEFNGYPILAQALRCQVLLTPETDQMAQDGPNEEVMITQTLS